MDDNKDELIIVSQPDITIPIQPVITRQVELPSESDGVLNDQGQHQQYQQYQPSTSPTSSVDTIPSTNVTTVSASTSFYSVLFYKENRTLVIHMISDFILFYFFFTYIQNQFNITEQMITFAKKRLIELRDNKKTERI